MRIGTRVRIPGNPGQRGVIQGRFCDGKAYLVGFPDGGLLKVQAKHLRREAPDAP